MKLTLIAGAGFVVLYGSLSALGMLRVRAAIAHDDRAEKAGIYAEQSTAVDGVTVRRIRDRSNGVVCYVASVPGYSTVWGTQPAIACIQENR